MKTSAARPAGPAMSSARRMCQLCPRNGTAFQPGAYLAGHLSVAMGASTLEDGFEISGTLTVDDCGGTCRLAWRASTDGVWVFGDVPEGAGIEAMITGTDARPELQATPMAMATTAMALCVTNRMRRRSRRSASEPPSGDMSAIGAS